jgi:hypothetical protein
MKIRHFLVYLKQKKTAVKQSSFVVKNPLTSAQAPRSG